MVKQQVNDLAPGTLINGLYRIEELVGHGWDSLYYRAMQLNAERLVAIKIIRPENANIQDLRDIFLDGARLMARLEHQHIVPIYDVDHFGDRPFCVMRYLPDGSVVDLLDSQRIVSIAEKVRILREVADALDFAHSIKVFHGDIRTNNLLIDNRNRLYVSDFETHTDFGTIDVSKQRTSSYMFLAPERLENAPPSVAADVYSLAATAYSFLHKRPLFVGNDLKEHIELRKGTAQELAKNYADLPPSVNDVLAQALQIDPEKRHRSASEFVLALQNAWQQDTLAKRISVFISYSREDPNIATQLVNDLENNQFDVWFDKKSIVVGKAWEPQIRAGIRECDKFIAILSPDAVESEYVQAEIDYAKEKKKAIIPIVHRNCDVPLHIRLLQHISFDQLGYNRGFELLLRAIIE
jgi:serine/threonine protein kinase